MERLKQLCSLPGQFMDHHDARWSTFLSDNALVADPEAELAGDWLGKNWSQEEKRIFMDKYLQYPKVCVCEGGGGGQWGLWAGRGVVDGAGGAMPVLAYLHF